MRSARCSVAASQPIRILPGTALLGCPNQSGRKLSTTRTACGTPGPVLVREYLAWSRGDVGDSQDLLYRDLLFLRPHASASAAETEREVVVVVPDDPDAAGRAAVAAGLGPLALRRDRDARRRISTTSRRQVRPAPCGSRVRGRADVGAPAIGSTRSPGADARRLRRATARSCPWREHRRAVPSDVFAWQSPDAEERHSAAKNRNSVRRYSSQAPWPRAVPVPRSLRPRL